MNSITSENIEQRLKEMLSPTQLQVIDESAAHAGHAGANETGQGTHFRVRIACTQFEGLSRVQRHRLVYNVLKDFIDQGLHALAIEVQNP
ncbi:MAG: BolA family transcriptional regulator [Limnohabitans sp.]|nr:BolA family transcriptional regulator [Limnohabitans sp.]